MRTDDLRALRIDEYCDDAGYTADPEDAACTDRLRRLQRDVGFGFPQRPAADAARGARASGQPREPSAGGGRDVRPWPRGVRYAVLAILVAAALWGVVLVASGGTSAATRVVVAAVVVPALLTPVAVWGRRRR